MIEIARMNPRTPAELQQIDGLDRNFLRHEGDEVLAILGKAEAVATAALPPPMAKPLDGRTKHRLKHAQQFVDEKAQQLGLPVEMLARKRWLITLLQNLEAAEKAGKAQDMDIDSVLPREMTGWRKALLIPGLLEAMKRS